MEQAFKKLSSTDPEIILKGVQEISDIVESGESNNDRHLLFDAVTSLFYIDTFDRPDLRSAVAIAQKTVAGMGPDIIPFILEKIRDTDIKAELLFAQTCGLLGEKAIEPLLKVFDSNPAPEEKSFALYAFGKIKSPKIVNALQTVLKSVKSPSPETEDTAVRALGKICESMNPVDLTDTDKDNIFNTLLMKCSHSNDVIRSKAVRGLGKMTRYGFISDIQKIAIRNVCREILGLEDESGGDPAYLVRREALEILNIIK